MAAMSDGKNLQAMRDVSDVGFKSSDPKYSIW